MPWVGGAKVLDAQAWLQQQSYQAQVHKIFWPATQEKADNWSNGLMFGLPKRMTTLARRGYLTLIDLTYDMNGLKWKLFTLMVHDEYNSWHPGAHMLFSNKDTDIIAAFLRTIKR